MNRRKNSFGLSASELRVLHASHAASQAGMPFTAMLTVHFGQIDEPIGDAGAYLRRKVIDRLGTWFRRRQLPWVGAWVREIYQGAQREHFHVLLHLPQDQYDAFRVAVQRWWPRSINRRRRPPQIQSGPDLFDWADQRERLFDPAVRAVMRRSGVSSATAAVVVELAGLTRRSDHD
jgi:hypothetical protein